MLYIKQDKEQKYLEHLRKAAEILFYKLNSSAIGSKLLFTLITSQPCKRIGYCPAAHSFKRC